MSDKYEFNQLKESVILLTELLELSTRRARYIGNYAKGNYLVCNYCQHEVPNHYDDCKIGKLVAIAREMDSEGSDNG